MVKKLLKKTPPREQIFFVLALGFVAYLGVVTPRGAPAVDDIQRRVLADEKNRAGASETELAAWIANSQKPPQPATLADADEAKRKFASRFTALSAPESFARPTPFRPSSERYETLPPVTLAAPDTIALPGFDAPVGVAPEIAYQSRPSMRAARGIDLERRTPDGPFKDAQGGGK